MNVRLAAVADLPQGKGVRVEALGHRIALFRIGDRVHAIGDLCSHAEASLSEGEVFDLTVECPRHGSEFDLATGEAMTLPATRPVPVYEVKIADGVVFADLEPVEEDS
ncbi:MAG TPA: non-heme iron oxygenase ferredoxin subunit [Acidimicrobiia bacterium]